MKPVLVDTSVWIRLLRGDPSCAAPLESLADRNLILGHDLVYGELLIGDTGGRIGFLKTYAQLPTAPVVPHDEVVALTRMRALAGRGLSWIDVHLLASALASGRWLWSEDRRLGAAARELNIAWDGSGNSNLVH